MVRWAVGVRGAKQKIWDSKSPGCFYFSSFDSLDQVGSATGAKIYLVGAFGPVGSGSGDQAKIKGQKQTKSLGQRRSVAMRGDNGMIDQDAD
jgi:hypothetical protein